MHFKLTSPEALEQRNLLSVSANAGGPYTTTVGNSLDLLGSVSLPSFHSPLKVVATGDSQTVNYSGYLQSQLNAAGVNATAYAVASGGSTALRYGGLTVDPLTGTAHDFANDALALNPDIVIFQLGVNDAFQTPDGFTQFQSIIAAEFNKFDAAHVSVIVGANLPVLNNPGNASYALSNQRIQTEYNPWLQQQAQQRGYLFINNYNDIQQQPNWQSLYSDDAVHPGYVHLWGNYTPAAGPPGYHWLANQYVQGIQKTAGEPTDTYSYSWDINNDGVYGDAVGSSPTLSWVALAGLSIGSNPIKLQVTDVNNGLILSASTTLNIQNNAVLQNGNLIWTGTTGSNSVQFTQMDSSSVRVAESGFSTTYSGVNRVFACGTNNDDTLDASGLNTIPATLNGGAGNNTLYGGQAGDILIGGSNGGEGHQGNNNIIAGNGNNIIYGNDTTGLKGSIGGNNIIQGGSGNDIIYGNFGTVLTAGQASNGGEGGQNIIVGNGGNDSIYAFQQIDGGEGGHGSILIAGTTTLNQAALSAAMAEWTSKDNYATRIALSGLQAGTTVFNSPGTTTLYGTSVGSLNWFLEDLAVDVALRTKQNEIQTGL